MSNKSLAESLKEKEIEKKEEGIKQLVVISALMTSILLCLFVGYKFLSDQRVITYFPDNTYSVDQETFLVKVTEEKSAVFQERKLRAVTRRFYQAFFTKDQNLFDLRFKYLRDNSHGRLKDIFDAYLDESHKYKEKLSFGDRWDFYPVHTKEKYRQRRIDANDPSKGWVVTVEGILVKRRNSKEAVFYAKMFLHIGFHDAKKNESLSGLYYEGFKFQYIYDPISGERRSKWGLWKLGDIK
jgi:hypothetical protein